MENTRIPISFTYPYTHLDNGQELWLVEKKYFHQISQASKWFNFSVYNHKKVNNTGKLDVTDWSDIGKLNYCLLNGCFFLGPTYKLSKEEISRFFKKNETLSTISDLVDSQLIKTSKSWMIHSKSIIICGKSIRIIIIR